MKLCQKCNKKFQENLTFCPYDGQLLIQQAADGQDQLIGTLLDKKYQIQQKIATGGMSTVYLALHTHLNLPVVVKVLHKQRVDEAAIQRFRREAQTALQVRHTNAVAVMDFSITETGIVYLVMEYLQGRTLAEKLKSERQLSLVEVNAIMQQVCAAVEMAHRRGIVHRDLKPSNIFLERDGERELVKVLDFGIAKLALVSANSIVAEEPQLTNPGFVVGSPSYMSPEQCSGESIDARADVYALGVILFELLIGELPFIAATPAEIFLKHMLEPPPSLCKLRPELPDSLDKLLADTLAKDRQLRPKDVGEFAERLSDVLTSMPVTVSKPHTKIDQPPAYPSREVLPHTDEAIAATLSVAASNASSMIANIDLVDLITQGVDAWNSWRKEHMEVIPKLSNISLKKANLTAINLNGAELDKADLNGVILNNANLQQACLRQAELLWAKLQEADLSGADLSSADLREADLTGSQLAAANFNKAIVSKANFAGANLTRANFHLANLKKTLLTKANLSYADLHEVDLSNAKLTDANLTGANLKAAILQEALLTQADLSSADLRAASFAKADLRGACLQAANFNAVILTKADLRGADLRGAYYNSGSQRKLISPEYLIWTGATFDNSTKFGERPLR
ncbi:MAG: serine/threonine-protein kinase [Acidobacteriota bacterium]